MRKLIWPILGTIVMAIFTTVQDALTDNHIDSQEWVLVGLGVLMAFNVWATANLPQYTKMKTYVAAAIVVAGALHTFIVGGVSMQEWVNLVVLALAGLGVAATPQPITTVINGTTVPANGEVRGTNREIS
jgi:predicted MFS family arabinose efflux permease